MSKKIVIAGKRAMFAGILAAVGVCLILTVVYMKNSGTKVERAVVVKEHVEDFYTEEGVLSGGRQYRIIAEVSGPVKEIDAKENAKVKKGEVLLQIDSSDYEHEKYKADCVVSGYEAQLEASRIGRVMQSSPKEYLEELGRELSARESAYRAVKTVYEGSRALYEAGSISRTEMEQRKAEYQSSLLSLEQVRNRYEESSRVFSELKEEGISEAKINERFYQSEEKQLEMLIETGKHQAAQLDEKIAKCVITAPEDGVITELTSEELTVIQAGQEVAAMTGTGKMTAEADVLTNIAPYLNEGDPAEIVLKLRGKDLTFAGHICQVYDFAKPGVSSLGLSEYRVHVIVELDKGENEELSGIDGYDVHVKFRLFDCEDCLTVPSGAVYQADGESYVYRIEGNVARKQNVEVVYQSGSGCVIGEGLSEGEEVIAEVDTEGVWDGAKVR